uniref:Uncharacterized protein n=1 Tax=Anopheles quadriannulatus TaxID=34691 RepID=A0A182XR88_ANOQN
MLLAAYRSIAVHRAFISLSCVVRCGCGTVVCLANQGTEKRA